MNDLKKTCVICESVMLEERNTTYYFVLKSILLMAPNYKKHNLKDIYADGIFSKDIVIKLDLHHVKLFNNCFHLKMNYEKSVGPIYNKMSHLINMIMNASSEEKFNQYTKNLLTMGKGKLIQLVNDMIKNEE